MNLLINPPSMVQSGYTPPPLGLLYLAAMDADTVVYDAALDVVRGRPDRTAEYLANKPRVAGVPVYTAQRHDSWRILKMAKEAGAVTVAGGPHVAVMLAQVVQEYGDFVDHFVSGDGEPVWEMICHRHNVPQVMSRTIVNLDDLPLPAWDRVPLLSYPARGKGVHRGNDLSKLPRISVVFGRGCSGHCAFCSAFWVNGEYRHHGRKWMAFNLEQLWQRGVRHLVFQDDCLTADREAALMLCEILCNYSFSWHATTRVDCIDDELATAMAAAGCYATSFGIESGSPTILTRMGKQIDLSAAFVAKEACRKAGIHFSALLMGGYPGQTRATAEEDADFRQRLNPDSVGTIGCTWVFPGTRLYQECKCAGLIDDSFWLGPEPYYVYQGGLP